jgi:hypothetical protein
VDAAGWDARYARLTHARDDLRHGQGGSPDTADGPKEAIDLLVRATRPPGSVAA